MKVVISGASGFIGSVLKSHFRALDYDVISITRKHYRLNIHEFKEIFRETDVFINLTGESILQRWTASTKTKLFNSRIETTEKVITAFKLLKDRPKLFIASSAIGIYSQKNESHTENSTEFANNYLGNLVKSWENSNIKASDLHQVRLIIMRLGIVLGKSGGAYRKMRRPFRFGVGGRIGNGNMPFSFIHIDDLIGAIDFFMQNGETKGIYNLCAPNPVSNKEFSKQLGKSLNRPSFMIIPEFILRLKFGKAASVLIKTPKVVSGRLGLSGFKFKYPTIEESLKNLAQKNK